MPINFILHQNDNLDSNLERSFTSLALDSDGAEIPQTLTDNLIKSIVEINQESESVEIQADYNSITADSYQVGFTVSFIFQNDQTATQQCLVPLEVLPADQFYFQIAEPLLAPEFDLNQAAGRF